MIASTKTSKLRTTKGITSFTKTFVPAVARNDGGVTSRRGTSRSKFTGAVVHNDIASSSVTVEMRVTNDTTVKTLDRVTMIPGETVTWTEEEYGFVLEGDQKIVIANLSSIASSDKYFVFVNYRDIA